MFTCTVRSKFSMEILSRRQISSEKASCFTPSHKRRSESSSSGSSNAKILSSSNRVLVITQRYESHPKPAVLNLPRVTHESRFQSLPLVPPNTPKRTYSFGIHYKDKQKITMSLTTIIAQNSHEEIPASCGEEHNIALRQMMWLSYPLRSLCGCIRYIITTNEKHVPEKKKTEDACF